MTQPSESVFDAELQDARLAGHRSNLAERARAQRRVRVTPVEVVQSG